MIRKTKSYIKTLGIYQIIGGVFGIALIIYFTAKTALLNITHFKLTLLLLSFYVFSTYCGLLLLKKKYDKGLNLSILNQALQIISFSVLGFTFKYTSGIYLSFGFNLTTDTLITYNFGLTTFDFKMNSNPEVAAFSINIFALILIHFLFNLKEKIIKEDTSELFEIGKE